MKSTDVHGRPRRRLAPRVKRGFARLLAGSFLLMCAASCSPAMTPRTADLASAGKFAVTAGFAGWSFGTGTLANGQRESTSGMEIPPDGEFTFDMFFAVAGLWDFEVRYGLSSWAEVGAEVGFQRLGGEVRVGVLDEDGDDHVSMALSAGGYYSAIGGGPWGRAGVDLSMRLYDVAPLVNVYLSYGSSFHSAIVDMPGNDDCPMEAPFMACGEIVGARWNELRLSTALGLAIRGNEDISFAIGLVPHVILAHTSPERAPERSGLTLSHEAGLHIVFGLQTPGW